MITLLPAPSTSRRCCRPPRLRVPPRPIRRKIASRVSCASAAKSRYRRLYFHISSIIEIISKSSAATLCRSKWNRRRQLNPHATMRSSTLHRLVAHRNVAGILNTTNFYSQGDQNEKMMITSATLPATIPSRTLSTRACLDGYCQQPVQQSELRRGHRSALIPTRLSRRQSCRHSYHCFGRRKRAA